MSKPDLIVRRLLTHLALSLGLIACGEVGPAASAAQVSVAEKVSVTRADPSSTSAVTELSAAGGLLSATRSHGARTGAIVLAYEAPAVALASARAPVSPDYRLPEVLAGGGGLVRPEAEAAGSTMTSVSLTSTPSAPARGGSVPDPVLVRRPSGAPNRDSPWYVSYSDADGNIRTVGNAGGKHAEVRIQEVMPGAPMSRPFGWRTVDGVEGPQWVPGTVCAGCQQYPPTLFPPGTQGAPGGPWGSGP
jgi:hypothetical protein